MEINWKSMEKPDDEEISWKNPRNPLAWEHEF